MVHMFPTVLMTSLNLWVGTPQIVCRYHAKVILDIVVKAARNGGLDAAFNIRFDLDTSKATVILVSENAADQYEAFMNRFELPEANMDGFALILSILEYYDVVLGLVRSKLIYDVTGTERKTGKGWVNQEVRGNEAAMKSCTQDQEIAIHTLATRTRSSSVAADNQVELINFLIETHQKYRELRARRSGHNSSSHRKCRAMADALRAHRSKLIGAAAQMKYWQERATTQTHVVSSSTRCSREDDRQQPLTIDKAEVVVVRSDSKTIKVIAAIQMFYLPFTFIAQIFSTGFFTFPDRRTSGFHIDPWIWVMLLVGFAFTFVTAMALPLSSGVRLPGRMASWQRWLKALTHTRLKTDVEML